MANLIIATNAAEDPNMALMYIVNRIQTQLLNQCSAYGILVMDSVYTYASHIDIYLPEHA
jgi:hypothetical protein